MVCCCCFDFNLFFFVRLDYPGDYPFRLQLEECVKWSDEREYKKTIVTNSDDDQEKMEENSKNIHIDTMGNNSRIGILANRIHCAATVPYTGPLQRIPGEFVVPWRISSMARMYNGMIGTMRSTIANPINTYGNSSINCISDKNVVSESNDNVNSNSDNDNYNGEMIYKPPSPSPNRKNDAKPAKPTKPPITHKAYLVEALTKVNYNRNKNDNSTAAMTSINDYNSLHEISQSNRGIPQDDQPGGDECDVEHDEHDGLGGARSDTSGGGRSRAMRKSIQTKIKQMAKQEKKLKKVNVGSSVAFEIVRTKPKRRRRRRGKHKRTEGKMNKNLRESKKELTV